METRYKLENSPIEGSNGLLYGIVFRNQNGVGTASLWRYNLKTQSEEVLNDIKLPQTRGQGPSIAFEKEKGFVNSGAEVYEIKNANYLGKTDSLMSLGDLSCISSSNVEKHTHFLRHTFFGENKSAYNGLSNKNRVSNSFKQETHTLL